MTLLMRNIVSRYYRDNEMISFTRTSFSYDSLNEGSYYVFVGTMAQETDASSAPQVTVWYHSNIQLNCFGVN